MSSEGTRTDVVAWSRLGGPCAGTAILLCVSLFLPRVRGVDIGYEETARLFASDAAAYDWFGGSVAISGDTAIVGASYDDGPAGTHQGSAYVFVRSGATWTEQAHLFASDAAMNDRFGISVAISGDYAIMGALNDDDPVGTDPGSAYIFVRSGTIWTQQAQLFASGAAAGGRFGWPVAISGDTAIVGAPAHDGLVGSNYGSAHVYVRSGTNWTEQAHLFASDAATNDGFGRSLAISGDHAMVGADYDNGPIGPHQGSAYIFSRSGTLWTQRAHLFAPDGVADGRFGVSVAISGDHAIVGALNNDGSAGTDQGSAYVFARGGTLWTQQAHLVASGDAMDDLFGWSVAISGDTAMVGAIYDTVPAGVLQGSVYAFVRSDTTWTKQARLVASDAAANDQFGISVAISGDYAIVGALNDDGPAGIGQGSAYVFVPECSPPSSSAPCTRPVSDYVGDGGSFLNPGAIVVPLNVPDLGVITDVELTINVAPLPRFKNNTVRLVHGPSVTLMQAGSTSDASGLSGTYTFDDEATATLNSSALAAAGNVPPGVYRGVSALSVFDGLDMAGDWFLQIEDVVLAPPIDPQAAHVLNSWTLTITSEMDDENVCTCTRCANGACRQTASEYGDVNCTGSAHPNLDDILCVFAGFGTYENCPNADIAPSCEGDGIIDVDDILAVLAAFGGADPCGCSP